MGKVISTSAKHRDRKPIAAMITVLYNAWVGHSMGVQAITEVRSKTFHVKLGWDGQYHYEWQEIHIDQETNRMKVVTKDHVVSANFIVRGLS